MANDTTAAPAPSTVPMARDEAIPRRWRDDGLLSEAGEVRTSDRILTLMRIGTVCCVVEEGSIIAAVAGPRERRETWTARGWCWPSSGLRPDERQDVQTRLQLVTTGYLPGLRGGRWHVGRGPSCRCAAGPIWGAAACNGYPSREAAVDRCRHLAQGEFG